MFCGVYRRLCASTSQFLIITIPCCSSEADLSFSLPVSVSSRSLFSLPTSYFIPSSVQLLQDAQASEGQVVVLECRVRGSPPLQVRWYRQGEEILDSPDFRILQKSETFFLVLINTFSTQTWQLIYVNNQNISVCLLFLSANNILWIRASICSWARYVTAIPPRSIKIWLGRLQHCFHVPNRRQWLKLVMDY